MIDKRAVEKRRGPAAARIAPAVIFRMSNVFLLAEIRP
jgi:hypothetical protein